MKPFTRHYQLTEENHRCLIWLTKSRNATVSQIDVPDTANKLLNGILEAFWTKNYPEIQGYLKKRSQIDSEAIEHLTKKEG